jgi:hypothetical protein
MGLLRPLFQLAIRETLDGKVGDHGARRSSQHSESSPSRNTTITGAIHLCVSMQVLLWHY